MTASAPVREFFHAYARATASLDTAFLESAYAASFMFASPSGTMCIKLDDFLKVVPKRRAFFDAAGWKSTELETIEEAALDAHYVQVKAHWTFHFEKAPGGTRSEAVATTYILRREADGLRIVFQLDHDDLTRRLQPS